LVYWRLDILPVTQSVQHQSIEGKFYTFPTYIIQYVTPLYVTEFLVMHDLHRLICIIIWCNILVMSYCSQFGICGHTTRLILLQPFYGPLSETTWVSRYQKKHSLTHLPWLSTFLYQLRPSTTIHGILLVQFMCLTVFLHNFSPHRLWSVSLSGALHFILHTFLRAIIVLFSQHMPIPSQPVVL